MTPFRPPSSAASTVRRPTGGVGVFGWLLLLALPVFFVALGANSIWDANEAFYVDTPRQMVSSGDYVMPMFNAEPRLNKPVLSYWIVAALYRLLGVSVTSERIGIALGVLGIIAATFVVGRAWRSTRTGVLAALIVATAPRVVMWGRRIFIDIYITMFMSIALACFVAAERHPEHRRRYLLLMYVSLGLGVLTKGPVALVLPAVACAIWLGAERRLPDLRRLMLGRGTLIILAIVVPWYAALVVRDGWAPVSGFFIGENLDRFTTSMQPDVRPFWFYVPVLFTDLFPWAPLVAVPLLTAWRRSAAPGTPEEGAIRRLLWIWTVVIVGAFSFSQTKQDLYIFPAVAAVAALIAETLERTAFGAHAAAVRLLLGVAAALSTAAGAAAFRYFGMGGYYDLAGARMIGVVLGAGGLAVLILVAWRKPRAAAITLAATFIAFNYVFVAVTLPAVERLKPVVPLAREFRERAAPDAALGSYAFMLPSLVYYAGRPVQVLESVDQAREFYADPRGGWAIMDAAGFAQLQQALPGLCVAAHHARLDPRLTDVLDGRRPDDVLLVTNQCQAAPVAPPGGPATN
jgi:4-amino-4-deoxy-L-arabinose transferase-like glycosyltransferase